MPAWLVEGDPFVFFLLAGAFVALVAAWWRTRKRRYAVAAGVVAALTLGYFLLDRFVESAGEQMTRKVREVAAAVSANEMDAAFRNVSESFERGGVNKQQFRRFCEGARSVGNVTDVQVWDLTAVDVAQPARTGNVEFHFKLRGRWGETPPNYFGKVIFTLDPDEQWRVTTFDVYDSLNQSKTPIAIPGWGSR